MISRLVTHLEAALGYARTVQAQIEGDSDEWSDEAWDAAHTGFAREFLAAIAEAHREEMLPEDRSS